MLRATLSGREELDVRINALGKILLEQIINQLEKLGKLGRDAMRQEAPVATGKLKESIKSDVERYGGGATLTIFPEAKYAIFVEKGRDAGGAPPIENLRVWANAKGFPESKIFYLQRLIASGQTKANEPNPFVEKTFEDVEKETLKMVREAIKVAVRRAFA